MDIVLGAGPNGLLVGKRLKELGIRYLILEKSSKAGGNVGSGFFFLHEPIFGDERKFRVKISLCGTVWPQDQRYDLKRMYAEKVYGDASVGPVSIKTEVSVHDGYELDASRLREISDQLIIREVEIWAIDPERKVVCTKGGQSWPYDRLHSAIPLSALSLMLTGGERRFPSFHSKPIWISKEPIDRVSFGKDIPEGDMNCVYCPGRCHSWYRATAHGRSVSFEHSDANPTYASYPVYPGKIWYSPNPMGGIAEEIEIENLRNWLREQDIYLWGRYGAWKPKMLTHHTWNELQKLR